MYIFLYLVTGIEFPSYCFEKDNRRTKNCIKCLELFRYLFVSILNNIVPDSC